MMVCECAQNWRLELIFWGTGDRLSIIVPESFEFESQYQEHGRGTVVFKMQGVLPPLSQIGPERGVIRTNQVPLFDTYPGDCGIIISRISGPDANWDGQKAMFAGIIDRLTVDSSGLVNVGLVEITEWLEHRVLREPITFTNHPQTDIAAVIVNHAYFGNFPPDDRWVEEERARLHGEDLGSSINRDRTYGTEQNPTPILWDLLKNLMQVENGPDYRLNIDRFGSIGEEISWLAQMRFGDQGTFQEDIKTIFWEDVVDAELILDRRERAGLVEVFARDGLHVTRTLEDANSFLYAARSRYLRYDTTRSYDVTTTAAAADFGDGFVLDHHDNSGSLRLQFVGLEYSPSLTISDFVPGDYVNVRIDSAQVPWTFNAGPDIDVDTPSGPMAVNDLQFGRVSVSAPNDGPERVSVDLITSKPFLPIEFGQ